MMCQLFLIRDLIMRIKFVLILCGVIGVLFGNVLVASADTVKTGTIVANETWSTSGGTYIVDGTVTIGSGVTVTIEPGVVVKFKTLSSLLSVTGTLNTQGSSSSPVYFTSYKDDVGGDTNGDGSTTFPAAGNWRQIFLNSGSTVNLSHAVVRYGGNSGSSYRANIYNNGGTLTVATSTIAYADTYGIRVAGGTLAVTGTEFVESPYALHLIDPDFLTADSGNTETAESEASNKIFISGTLNNDKTLTLHSAPYIFDAVTVATGKTLTVLPGTIIKFWGLSSLLTVNGTLSAIASSSLPIYFTSYKDDVGGDTNGDGSDTSPSPGDWRQIFLNSGSTANISHAIVRYGGNSGTSYRSNIHNSGGALTVSTSTISWADTYGIRVTGGTLSVTGTEFIESPYALHLTDPDFLIADSGNIETSADPSDNKIFMSGTLSNSKTLTLHSVPYIFDSVTVDTGKTLTVLPGTIIKFWGLSSLLTISGTLDAVGSSSSPIYLTSYKDDAVGGDTNGDGSTTSPAAGDWRQIFLNSGSTVNLAHTVIRYGGNSGTSYRANIYNNGGALTIATSTIALADTYGIRVVGGTAAFNGNQFVDNPIAAHIVDPDFLGPHSGNTATSSSASVNGIQVTGTLNNNRLWISDNMPYVISGAMTISSGKTLVVSDGAVFKFLDASSYISVGGTLSAIGWNYEGGFVDALSFTSIKDDTIMGDTNGDGSATSPASGDWRGIELGSGASSTLLHSDVFYGGNSGGPDGSVYNNGGTLTIGTSTIASSTTSGIFHNAGTTNVFASVIQHNSSYGLRHSGTLSTTTAEYNFWGSHTGPTHASNPGGTGDVVTSNVDFSPWLDDEHYIFPENAVDATGGYHIQWEWAVGSTQEYVEEWEAAIATWNALGAVDIRPYESGVNDVTVQEVDEPTERWSGLYEVNLFSDDISLNRAYVDDYAEHSRAIPQSVWTHELGHALGLNHSYWGNILYETLSTQVVLGAQDLRDYFHCWFDDQC